MNFFTWLCMKVCRKTLIFVVYGARSGELVLVFFLNSTFTKFCFALHLVHVTFLSGMGLVQVQLHWV